MNVTAARRGRRLVGARLDRLSDNRFAALALLPGVLLVGLVVVPPVAGVLGLSLFRVELLRDDLRPFVGLNNFLTRMQVDTLFTSSLPRSVVFSLVATLLAVPVALASALLVNSRGRGATLLGLLLLLPWAVAPLADGVFWRLVFDTKYGLVNDALGAFGVAPVRWTTEGLASLVVTLVAVVWRATPLLAVLLLGALRAVPAVLGRAARMDGASPWQTFRYVTLPAIRPTLLVVCVIEIVLSLQVFDISFAITRGVLIDGGVLPAYAIFDTVINNLSFGYGAAQTVVLAGVIVLCLLPLVVLVRGSRGRQGRGAARGDFDEPLPALHLGAVPPVAYRLTAAGAPRWEQGRASSGRRRRGFGRRLRALGAAFVVLWLAGPIVWIAVVSIQPEAALRSVPPALTTNVTFDGFTRLLNDPAWQGALAVSVEVAVGATFLALVAATFAGYPLARIRFPGARVFLAMLLATQLAPPIALAIPVLMLFLAFGLKGTVPGLILVNAAFWTPILVWLVRAAFLAVPLSLERAARMDGLGRLGTILRVALPAAAPAIAAATVIVFVGVWNDFVFVTALGTRTTGTLPRFLTVTADPPYHVLAAGILLTIAPCLILIAALHRRILRAV